MIPVPSGVRVWLAVGHHGHAPRHERPGAAGAAGAGARSARRRSLRLPRPPRRPGQDHSGTTASACRCTPSGWSAGVPLAVAGGRLRGDLRRAAGLHARRASIGGTRSGPGGQRSSDSARHGAFPLSRRAVVIQFGPCRPVPAHPADDIDALRAALATEQSARQEAEARASGAEAMVAHLKLLIAKLKHDRFGASSERGRKLIDQLELELEELVAAASEDATAAETAAGKDKSAGSATPPPAGPRRRCRQHLPRERVVHPSALRLPLLRRPALQAGRGRHRDAGGGAAAVEGDPDRAREVLLPLLRGDHPAAGAVPPDRPRPRRPATCWP